MTIVRPVPIPRSRTQARAKLDRAIVLNTAPLKPMISTAARLRFLQLTMCLALCGCGTAEQLAEPAAAPAPIAKTETKQSDPKVPAVENSSDKKDSAKTAGSEPQPEQQAFEPPYPHRENLFLAPQRSAVNIDTPGNTQQSVELLGFANVQGPRVILSIDGIVVPMPVGATQSGIEVISIQPPAVVLQRDRERWQATLEN
jgi:hypothetical protein